MSAETVTLGQYNELYRKCDEILHNAVKTFDVSDGTFWVLYTLRDIGPAPTQRELYRGTCMPKQTVNSAVNRLIAQGYIQLEDLENSRNRRVLLTESGEALARRTADVLRGVERQTMSEMPEHELELMLELMRKYNEALAANIKKMILNMPDGKIKPENGENTQ